MFRRMRAGERSAVGGAPCPAGRAAEASQSGVIREIKNKIGVSQHFFFDLIILHHSRRALHR